MWELARLRVEAESATKSSDLTLARLLYRVLQDKIADAKAHNVDLSHLSEFIRVVQGKTQEKESAEKARVAQVRAAEKNLAPWEPQRTLTEQKGQIIRIAFSPDGKYFATGTHTGNFTLWDQNGNLVVSKRESQNDAENLFFSPDGTRFLGHTRDKIGVIWDLTGDVKYKSDWFDSSIVFNRDGSRVITGNLSGEVVIRNRDGKPLHTIEANKGAINGIVFSEAGSHFATFTDKNILTLRKANGDEVFNYQFKVPQNNLGAGILSVAVNRDASRVAILDKSNGVILLDGLGNEIDRISKYTIWLSFLPDGRGLVLADQTAIEIRDENGKNPKRIKIIDGYVKRYVIHPNGNEIVALVQNRNRGADGRLDSKLISWDLEGATLYEQLLSGLEYSSLRISPDGSKLVIGTSEGVSYLWQKPNPEQGIGK
jgi:WD40 repeat protein